VRPGTEVAPTPEQDDEEEGKDGEEGEQET